MIATRGARTCTSPREDERVLATRLDGPSGGEAELTITEVGA